LKREIKIVPLILSVLGFFAVGLAWGSLNDVITQTELVIGIVLGSVAFGFILLLSIGFPLTKEDRDHTKISW
jgi:hypothetical protein